MKTRHLPWSAAAIGCVLALATPARAHSADFKSPNPGMHFTQGQPLVVFSDLADSREGKGIITCPAGQTVTNRDAPDTHQAVCSGGGTPTGWPMHQMLVDAVKQTDVVTGKDTVPNTTKYNGQGNPDPIGFFRFVVDTKNLSVGSHQLVVHGLFSADGVKVDELDSKPLTFYIDAPPAKTVMNLDADFTGAVSWNNVIVVGNGHKVTAKGAVSISGSLVTGIGGLGGNASELTIEDSIFEDSGEVNLTLGDGAVSIKNTEFRANNRLTFVASDPGVPFILELHGGGSAKKVFQGNRIGAGQLRFGGQNWLVGGDTDDQSNILIGPRTVLNVDGSDITIRGNYSHHNYRGAWSQGFNFFYMNAGSNVLTEHNFIRDSSWPVQSLAGEFRYNTVLGYGHTWVRTMKANAVVHHNVFAPGGDGGLNDGIQAYGGESGLVIYNNTFDGGGAAIGDFAGPTIGMSGGSKVTSLRNNLITFSRNQQNDNPGDDRVTGGAGAYAYADYNAFFSPDNKNKTRYDFSGAGTHDPSGDQLAANPFAGDRIAVGPDRVFIDTIDEDAVWNRTQKLSQVLAIVRNRYAPKSGSAIIDAGDPADDDSMGRRTDIGAIDLGGHDQDRFGKFGMPPSELVPPTVTLTAPTAGAELTGKTTLSATAMDNPGGSGVVLVQFLVDGATVGQSATSPYSIQFDTATIVNGDHSFSAKAWDGAGNFGVSAPVKAHTTNAMVVSPDAGPETGGAAGAGGGASGGASNAGGGTTSVSGGTTGAPNGGAAAGGGGGAGAPSTPGSDAGTARDAGSGSSSCGCRVVTRQGTTEPALGALAVLLGALTARRRRRRESSRRTRHGVQMPALVRAGPRR